MPRRTRTRRTSRRSVVPRRTQRIRSLAGQRPMTRMEQLARFSGNVGSIARTVSAMAGLINSEVKFVDTSLNGTLDAVGTGYSSFLTSIAEGDDSNQRNGRKVLYKNLDLKYFVQNQSTTVPAVCGMAIVMDTKPDAGTTDWDNIFTAATPMAPIDNLTHSGRFVILKRWFFKLEPLAANNSDSTRTFKAFINLKGIHEQFDGTGATDFEKNKIVLCGITNATVNFPIVQGISRINYYDN